MSSARLLILVSLTLFFGKADSFAEVALPKGGLYKPTFLLADRSFAAGTAFTTQISVKGTRVYLLVSCHHVLDNAASEICSTVALSMADKEDVLIASKPLIIAGARSVDFAGAECDISAFVLRSPPKKPVLQLSLEQPIPGERISLYARLYNQKEPQIYLGTVVNVRAGHLEYRLDDPTVEIGGTSGAPVLNGAGKVIGVNVSGARQEDGTLHVLANPTTSFRPRIQTALENLK